MSIIDILFVKNLLFCCWQTVLLYTNSIQNCMVTYECVAHFIRTVEVKSNINFTIVYQIRSLLLSELLPGMWA